MQLPPGMVLVKNDAGHYMLVSQQTAAAAANTPGAAVTSKLAPAKVILIVILNSGIGNTSY